MESKSETLSIIIPAYNEGATFRKMMDAVLAQPLDDLEKEIIIIESNSSDNTRSEVMSYKDIPNIRIIFEERPQGKGHAVREGLKCATGDYILIQDADLEYDVADYPKLLVPLCNGGAKVVLGSRHNGTHGHSFSMRQFKDRPITALFMNVGHIFFTGLFNIVYGQNLKDPFTMYKVFRRECIDGLTFEANRFDFDWELLGKLCRKGYKPLEISITYQSRHFGDGKKVSIFRDPITWIIACFKYRFTKL
ncbi:MAG: glycosyltransferase family 2 protein [Holosporales bacterium]|nr:glycosyltransferase family 2 protein [Holosporales bacterium]